MESDKFDNLVRGAFEGASRRKVVRVGIGSLAASALVTMGLRAEDADAKKKKKKKKNKVTCTGTTPVTCGAGCCATNYSLCCTNADDSTNNTTCNPPANKCCPIEQGGGSCRAGETCCPAGRDAEYGSCAGTNDVCCTTATGGGSCSKESPVCCPSNPANSDDFGECCKTGETCCIGGGAACPAGKTCDAPTGYAGCCVTPPVRSARHGKSGRARDGVAVS